jgi:disease resistance protein RPM1
VFLYYENNTLCFVLFHRYLIVIDDVWTKDAWEYFKCCFVQNNRGSRVLVTTRIEDVAKAWCPCFDGHVYRIQPLDDLDSKRLFHRRIFGFEDACPEQLKAVSDEILKKCGGLPLAILTVAGILASHEEVNSKQAWEKIKNYLGYQLERNHGFGSMRHVFNLGYHNLSLDLKTCMLYLGIFPEDSEILKADLINRWIAEGFIISKKLSFGPEEIAESHFNELINKNMIQVARMDDCGQVVSCRVHDVMLEYITLKAAEENFVTIISDLQNTSGSLKARRLSLQLQVRNSGCNNHAREDLELIQVRSLNFWGPAECMPSLSKFRLVRVVHLDVNGSEDDQCDMSSFCKFFQLRYLRVRGLGCRKLPTQLHTLQHLQTLEIHPGPGKKATMEINATKLPPTLWHLVVPSRVKMIGAMERMTALRTLALGELDIHPEDAEKSIKSLGELSKLRELKLSLSRSCSQKALGVVGDLLPSSLCRLSNLDSLIIGGSFATHHEVIIDALTRWHTPPRHLRRLHALACPFSTVPTDWITQLDGLRSLEIKVVSLPRGGAEVLARLTSLVHLRLHVDKQAPEEGVVIRRAAFPHLKEFWFAHQVPCLMFEAGAMPGLQNLTVQRYVSAERQTHAVLDGIEHLGSLKLFRVDIAQFEIELQAAHHVPEKEVQRWNKQELEKAFRMAISKHPGSLNTRIQHVYRGTGLSYYYTF